MENNMSRNIDVKVKCPFYQEEPSCDALPERARRWRKHVTRRRIRCEGLTPEGKIFLEFKSPEERTEHYNNFCTSECWRGCPLAQMLEAK